MCLLITPWPHDKAPSVPGEGPPLITTVENPNLDHLTLDPVAHKLSGFRVHAPNLTSLHIALSDYVDTTDMVFIKEKFLSAVYPQLRILGLSGDNKHVSARVILMVISALIERDSSLARLEIRDLKAVTDISIGTPNLHGSGRIQFLYIDNFTWCSSDEIMLTGPSPPREVDIWLPLSPLLEHSERYRIFLSSGECLGSV
jgi:hypothetical protein